MSLYQVQKFLYHLNRDPTVQAAYETDQAATLDGYELDEEERRALLDGDIGLLYVLGVNGQILMHFAALSRHRVVRLSRAHARGRRRARSRARRRLCDDRRRARASRAGDGDAS